MKRLCWTLALLASLNLLGCDHGGERRESAVSAEEPVTAPHRAPDQAAAQASRPAGESAMKRIVKTDDEWRQTLTPEQYRVLREKDTERPFTGKYWNTKQPGVYRCAACGAELFDSADKYDSGCGWPSFTKPAAGGKVKTQADSSHGMTRTEVVCPHCGGHLGHVFDDGPQPTGKRYCINSASLNLTAPAKPPERTQER